MIVHEIYSERIAKFLHKKGPLDQAVAYDVDNKLAINITVR